MRAATVALAALLVLAGCLGGPAGSPADPGTTGRSPTPTTTSPAPATATTTSPAAPPTTPGTLSPKPVPEKPDDLTAESVRAFVVAYEEAYVYNRAVEDGSYDRVNVACGVRSLNRTAGAFRVRVECGISTYRWDSDARATLHGDGFARATYLVEESATVRRDEL